MTPARRASSQLRATSELASETPGEVDTGLSAEEPPGLADALEQAVRPTLAEEERARAIVHSSDDAIYTKDGDAVITSWNAAAERLFGYSAEEAIGQPVAMIVAPERAGEELRILRHILAGKRVEHYETERRRKDGSRVWVSLTISPVYGPTGEIEEASVTARDVTARRQGLSRLQRLQRVTAALSEALTAREVVDVVLHEGFAAAGATAGIVATARNDDRLEVIASIGYLPEVIERRSQLELGEPTPITEAARTGRPVWLANRGRAVERFPALQELLEPGSDHALVALPLTAHGRRFGAIGLRLSTTGDPDADERALMLTLARQCAQALDRARLYEAEHDARATAEEQRRRAEFLARASSVLGASLDPEGTLEQVVRLAVPAIADWAWVELVTDGGTVERVAVVHADPGRERWALSLRGRFALDGEAPCGPAHVVRTAQPELRSEVSPPELTALVHDADELRAVRELGVASAMVVPLRARGRILGDIALVSSYATRRFGPDDLTMAQQLADRCAVAIDNARLFSERSYVAKTLQEGLLPTHLPDIPGVELAVRYLAAGSANEVGGDFYDVFALGDGRWTFVAGDVVGKGARAAAITGLARPAIRVAARYEREPSAVLRVLNATMLEGLTEARFSTVVCAHLDSTLSPARLTVSSAGHPLPFVLRADGAVEQVGAYGQPVGLLATPALEDVRVALHPGDTVVLYTDGVTEARGEHGVFGEAGLAALLAQSIGLPLATIAGRIERRAIAFGGPPRDDMAVVVFRLSVAP